jgi:hypothetical protein
MYLAYQLFAELDAKIDGKAKRPIPGIAQQAGRGGRLPNESAASTRPFSDIRRAE